MRTALLLVRLVAVLLAVSPVGALAADAKAKDEEGAAAGAAPTRHNEIERGFWLSTEAGPLGHVDWISTLPPTRIPGQLLPDDAGTGVRMGGRVGVDIFKLVSVDGFLLGQFREKRIRRGRTFTGDLSDFSAGVGLRAMPITIKDRLSFTARLGLGLSMLFPGEVAQSSANPGCILSGDSKAAINPLCYSLPKIGTPSNPVGFEPFAGTVLAFSPMAELMLGVEYFTNLRHFSLGADLLVGTILWPFTVNVGLVPHVKYTF